MKRLLGIAMLLLLALGLTCAKAAEKDLYIDGNVQRIFTSEDGLLSTSTQAIAQTSEGFVWIGGYGGLARYDGRRFVTFKDIYKRISRISDLAAGQEGELWIATSDKGLFRYQYGSFDAVCDGDGEVVQGINCLGLSPEGTLYLGMDSGLRVVEDGVVRALEIPGLAEEDVDRILCEADGRVLCLTHSGRLYVWDGHELIWVKAAKEFALRSVCYDAAHDAYRAGTSDNEVLTLDRDLHLVGSTSLAGLSCINDLRCDDSGALWLCADNGIGIYVKGSVRMQNLQMNNSVDKMMVDREGNYWFVSSRQGVLEVSRSKFGDVSRSAGLPSMVVNAIQRLDDTLYIGHDSGLEAISAVNFNRVSDPQLARLGDTRVRALLVDDVGNLWIGTMKKGLLRYVPGGEIVSYTTDNCPALASDNVRSIRSTDEGLLIGTDRGAYLVDGDGVRNVSKDPDALDFRILCAMKYGDTLCLGSDGNGLYLLKDGEIARHITTDDGLSSNVIMKAYWSQACRGLWLVTGNDIDFLGEDGAITSLSNFPTTNNLDIAIMQNGDAWIFTGSGIYQTVEASLLTDAEPRYLQFRHVDGLPYEVTPNSYQCMTGDTLYVCGSGGVFSLQTDFGQAETGSYQLTVDSVVADGQTLYVRPGEACQIDPGVKRIDINAYVLTYQTGNPFVFYYLEGFDDDQAVSQLSARGDISYTNLSGGSYTFHFGIQDHRTGETLQEITLPIVKRFAWYQLPQVQLAAAVLGVLALAALTLLIIRHRSRRIQRKLEEAYAQKEKQHLQTIAYQDYLTGLYNRNYLDVWNAQSGASNQTPVCFVSLDMNDLKKINDRHGHKEGDQLLCAMAGLLKKHFDGDAFCLLRIGGDEFLILSRGVEEDQVRRRLDAMAAEGRQLRVNDIPVTFGYGLYAQSEGEFNFEEGLRQSDLRMLENKNRFHGRGN